jgi:hypothetical protein
MIFPSSPTREVWSRCGAAYGWVLIPWSLRASARLMMRYPQPSTLNPKPSTLSPIPNSNARICQVDDALRQSLAVRDASEHRFTRQVGKEPSELQKSPKNEPC